MPACSGVAVGQEATTVAGEIFNDGIGLLDPIRSSR